MRILYEKTLDGVCLQRCYGLDKILEIPGTVDGMPVTEFAGYLFSDTVRRREPPPCEYLGEPELCGSRVEEIILPDTVRKVGAYGFYNCYGSTGFHAAVPWRTGEPGYLPAVQA